MQAVLALVERVAPTNTTVLIGGESGVGKDLIARAIHEHSQRASGPFVKINSTAIPETLLESELFGYEKGAFSGATTSKPGKFELANNGTLFLDEIGDVPAAIQVKLLRVLQDREFERLGGTKTLKVDVRLIAATNRDLRAALEEGTFREDLYYRLNVVAIDIPPLRDHKEDIPALAECFLGKSARESGKAVQGLTPAAMKLLMDFHWPGNVRELQNVLERAVTLSTGSTLDVADIHIDAVLRPQADSGSAVLPEGMTLEQWEEEMLREALSAPTATRVRPPAPSAFRATPYATASPKWASTIPPTKTKSREWIIEPCGRGTACCARRSSLAPRHSSQLRACGVRRLAAAVCRASLLARAASISPRATQSVTRSRWLKSTTCASNPPETAKAMRALPIEREPVNH